MKESDFIKIEMAAFELGFQAGLCGSVQYDEKALKKAKRKLNVRWKHFLEKKYGAISADINYQRVEVFQMRNFK